MMKKKKFIEREKTLLSNKAHYNGMLYNTI